MAQRELADDPQWKVGSTKFYAYKKSNNKVVYKEGSSSTSHNNSSSGLQPA